MQKDTWGMVKYHYSTSVIRTIPVLHILATATFGATTAGGNTQLY